MSKFKVSKTISFTRGGKIDFVGNLLLSKAGKEGIPYLRIEDSDGGYVGSVNERDIGKLKEWCGEILECLRDQRIKK